MIDTKGTTHGRLIRLDVFRNILKVESVVNSVLIPSNHNRVFLLHFIG